MTYVCAIQWWNKKVYAKWFHEAERDGRIRLVGDRLEVKVEKGVWAMAYVDDWVILGSDDKLHVCRDDYFKKHYRQL